MSTPPWGPPSEPPQERQPQQPTPEPSDPESSATSAAPGYGPHWVPGYGPPQAYGSWPGGVRPYPGYTPWGGPPPPRGMPRWVIGLIVIAVIVALMGTVATGIMVGRSGGFEALEDEPEIHPEVCTNAQTDLAVELMQDELFDLRPGGAVFEDGPDFICEEGAVYVWQTFGVALDPQSLGALYGESAPGLLWYVLDGPWDAGVGESAVCLARPADPGNHVYADVWIQEVEGGVTWYALQLALAEEDQNWC